MEAARGPNEERRLSAIMFTDIVGFTALAQKDEALSMRILGEHNQLTRSVLKRYGGREVKTMGDSFLVEFSNALDAVLCAVAIQQGIRERNSASPPASRVEVRIGIHIGDVIHRNGDIFGDAVNISSRILPLAAAGGVSISGQVYDQVRNKVSFHLVKMERQTLKNVNLPIEAYKVVMPWDERAAAEPVALDRRRIAVLPLRNMSPDPIDEYFADGMTEELITSLSGIGELTVIARTSVMQYKTVVKRVTEIGKELGVGTVIEGSVRKAGNRVRITVQAIDAQSEGHLWARNYDKELDDIFAVQSEIAEKVAETLRVRLLDSERRNLEKSPTSDAEAHTLYLKGKYFWNIRSKEAIEKAIEYFRLAVEHDPGFALGYSGLSECYGVMARNGLADPETTYPTAKEYALKALNLDPNLAEAHADLAGILYYFDHDMKKAESEFRKAIELKPNYSTAHQWYSHLLGAQGRFDEASAEITKALQLDPLSRVINTNVGDGLYYRGEYDRAIEQFKKVIQLDPNYAHVYPSLAQAYIRKAMYDEALKACERWYQITGQPVGMKLGTAYVYAVMGRVEESRKLLLEVQERFREEVLSAYMVGLVYFLLGDKDAGFEWLERAYNTHDPNIVQLNVDKELQNVKSDSRFISLLEKLNLG